MSQLMGMMTVRSKPDDVGRGKEQHDGSQSDSDQVMAGWMRHSRSNHVFDTGSKSNLDDRVMLSVS